MRISQPARARSSCSAPPSMFARAPFMIHDAPIRVDDGPDPEDLLLPRARGDRDVPRRRSSAASRAPCFSGGGVPIADHVAVAAAELAVVFGIIVLVTGPLWARKAWGVWWEWDVAPDDDARHVDDVRRLPAAAAVRRTRLRSARRGRRPLRHGARAVRLLVGELLADDSSRRRTSCRRCRRRWRRRSGGRCSRSCCCLPRCSSCASGSKRAGRRSRRRMRLWRTEMNGLQTRSRRSPSLVALERRRTSGADDQRIRAGHRTSERRACRRARSCTRRTRSSGWC